MLKLEEFFSTGSAALTYGLETKKGAEMNVRTKKIRAAVWRFVPT